MASASSESTLFTLTLSGEERTQLLNVLERTVRDTHVEARRTESPDFQVQVHQEEAVLRSLIDKIRHA